MRYCVVTNAFAICLVLHLQWCSGDVNTGTCTEAVLNTSQGTAHLYSSSFRHRYEPNKAVLNEGGAWIPSEYGNMEWLAVDLGAVWTISTLHVKTRKSYTYVKSLRVSSSVNNLTWSTYNSRLSDDILGEELFLASFGYVNSISLSPKITARFITFNPVKVNVRAYLEVELSGCKVGEITMDPFFTAVKGTIEDDQFWIPSMTPVVIDHQLTVGPQGSLHIKPGVTVIFTSSDSGIKVLGSLEAHGIPGLPVVLSSKHPVMSKPAQWRGIEVLGTGKMNVSAVTIRQAEYGIQGTSSQLLLRHCQIIACDVGVQTDRGDVGKGNVFLASSLLAYNNIGVRLIGTGEEKFFTIKDTVIRNGSFGIDVKDWNHRAIETADVELILRDSHISGHSSVGIRIATQCKATVLVHNTSFYSNYHGVVYSVDTLYTEVNIVQLELNISSSRFDSNTDKDIEINIASYEMQMYNIALVANEFEGGGMDDYTSAFSLYVFNSETSSPISLTISNNTFRDQGSHAIDATFLYASNITSEIYGNSFQSCYDGIKFKFSNEDTRKTSSVIVYRNVFSGIYGRTGSALNVENVNVNFTYNILENCSSSSAVTLTSYYSHTISRNIFSASTTCPCLLDVRSPFLTTHTVRAPGNYWGSEDIVHQIKPRICDFFVDSSRARVELGTYFPSEQMDTATSVLAEDDFKLEDGIVGGIIRSNLKAGRVSVLVKRSILVEQGISLEVEGHVSFDQDKGVVVQGNLTLGNMERPLSTLDASGNNIRWKGIHVKGGAVIIRNAHLSGAEAAFTQPEGQVPIHDVTDDLKLSSNIFVQQLNVTDTGYFVHFTSTRGAYSITLDSSTVHVSKGVYIETSTSDPIAIKIINSKLSTSLVGMHFSSAQSQTMITPLRVIIDNSSMDGILSFTSCSINMELDIRDSTFTCQERSSIVRMNVYSTLSHISNNTFFAGEEDVLHIYTCNEISNVDIQPLEHRHIEIVGNSFVGLKAESYLFFYAYYDSPALNISLVNNVFSPSSNPQSDVSGVYINLRDDSFNIIDNMMIENNSFSNFFGNCLHFKSVPNHVTITGNLFVNNTNTIYASSFEEHVVDLLIVDNTFLNNNADGIIRLDVSPYNHTILLKQNDFVKNMGAVLVSNTPNMTVVQNVFDNEGADFNIKLFKTFGRHKAFPLNATQNYWDTNDVRKIARKVYDFWDNTSLSNVVIMPCLGSRNLSDLQFLETPFLNSHAEIGGFLGGNTTLSAPNSPYRVIYDIVVRQNESLTIEPGVVILFDGGLGVNVYGSILVNGSRDSPVSMKPSTPGTKWKGIRIHSNTRSVLRNVVVHSTMEGIVVNGISTELTHVESRYSDGNGFTFNLDSPYHARQNITELAALDCGRNGVEILLENTKTEILFNFTFCRLSHNAHTGLHVNANVSVTVFSCIIENNGEGGVKSSRLFGTELRLENSVISKNAVYGVYAEITREGITRGDVWAEIDSSLSYNYTYVIQNTVFDGNMGGLSVHDDGVYTQRVGIISIENNTFTNNKETRSSLLHLDLPYLKHLALKSNNFHGNMANGMALNVVGHGNNEVDGIIFICNNSFLNNNVHSTLSMTQLWHVTTIRHNVLDNPGSIFELIVPTMPPSDSLFIDAEENFWGRSSLKEVLPRIFSFDINMTQAFVSYIPFMMNADLNNLFDGRHDIFSLSNVYGGCIVGNITLPKRKEPYLIQRSIFISRGARLVLEAGTTLLMQDGRGIFASGTLLTEGSDDLPVTVTGTDGKPWYGISINSSKHDPSYSAGLYVKNSDTGLTLLTNAISFSRSVIFNTSLTAISISANTDGEVYDLNGIRVKVAGQHGITVTNSVNLTLANAMVESASGSCVLVRRGYYFRLVRSKLSSCTSGLDADVIHITINDCQFINNSDYGAKLLMSNMRGGNNITITTNVFMNNNVTALKTEFPLEYYYHVTKKTLEVGFNTFTNNGLLVIGLGKEVYLSLHDNTITGFTGNPRECAVVVDQVYHATSNISILSNTFELLKADCIVKLTSLWQEYPSNSSFRYNRLTDNQATDGTIVLDSASYEISENIFDNPLSTFDLTLKRLNHEVNVSAIQNWWGSANPEFVQGRIYDKRQDPNLVSVLYEPFRTTQNFDCSSVNNCSERGECVRPDGCMCISGWTGLSCENYDCSRRGNCYGHGTCIGPNECACDSGWTGNQCIHATCTGQRNCSGRGICVRPDECLCGSRFTGNDCESCIPHHWGSSCLPCPDCKAGTCNLNKGTCKCDGENWTGFLCDKCSNTFYGPNCLPLMMLLSVLPNTGIDKGDNIVHLRGDNFPEPTPGEQYTCTFGSQVVFGDWLSPNHVTCIAPKLQKGLVIVELSANGVSYTTNKRRYTYFSSCPNEACGRDLTPPHGQCLFGSCTCNLPWTGDNCTTKLLEPILAETDQSQAVTEGSRYTYQPILIQGSRPVTWSILSAPTGVVIDERQGTVTWGNTRAGSVAHHISVRARNIVGSSSVSWKFSVSSSYYVSSASLDPTTEVFDQPRPVRIHGMVTFKPGFSTGVVPVKIVVTNGDRKEVKFTFTDRPDPESFSVYYYPFPDDAGRFEVYASHPADTPSDPVTSWSVRGMTCDPSHIDWTDFLDNGTAVNSNILLRNAGVDIINNIRAKVELVEGGPLLEAYIRRSGTDDTDFKIDTLEVDTVVPFDIVTTASGPLRGSVFVVFSSEAGTVTRLRVSMKLSVRRPALRFEPTTIKESVIIGKQKIVTAVLYNDGDVKATDVRVSLPDERLSLVCFSVMNSTTSSTDTMVLPPGGEAVLSMSVTTQPTENLGEMRGSIVVHAEPNSSVYLPYIIYFTSTRLLNMTFTVKDEYTYFADGSPLVSDATIQLFNQRQSYKETRNTSDKSGVVVFENILEDKYTLQAFAPGHGHVSKVILTSAHSPADDIFLPRIAVTYTWTVTPTTIQDKYVISLESTYETQVPMPVVTIDPMQVDIIPYERGEKNSIDFTITNHGLIRADNLRFGIPDVHPYLKFYTSIDIIGNLEANATLVVPIHVSFKSRQKRDAVARLFCALTLIYDIFCGGPTSRKLLVTMTKDRPGRPPMPCGFGGTGVSHSYGSGRGSVDARSGSGAVVKYNPENVLSCDCAKSLIKSCLLAFVPVLGCKMSVMDAASAVAGAGSDDVGMAVVASAVDVFCSCFAPLPVSILNSAAMCAKNIIENCSNSRRRRREISSEVVDGVITSATSLYNFFQMEIHILGDEAMFGVANNWYPSFKLAIADASDGGTILTEEEYIHVKSQQTNTSQQNILSNFLVHWNNTASAWENGTLAELSSTGSVINLSGLKPYLLQLHLDDDQARAKGFDTIYDEFDHAVHVYTEAEKGEGAHDGGVCAKVRIRIVQEVVLTRDAFNARLEIENGESAALETLKVEIWIKETFGSGEIKNELFAIGSPDLVGISGVNGTGRLGQDLSGSAEWLIIPTSLAAPHDDLLYDVGGQLSYSVGGNAISVSLLPDTITVKPTPSLVVHYFLEKYVQGDDPMTKDVVEPVVPFSLAVLVTNAGYGVARELKLTSSQPEIIGNVKGLLVSFEIISAQLGNEPITPSLTVDFGDIQSNQTKTARWLLTSSIMGTFNNFTASFENISPLGDPQLSLLDNLSFHELVHSVRRDNPDDVDGIDDFLVNDVVDENSYPDTLYNSQNGSDIDYVIIANVTRFECVKPSMKEANHCTTLTLDVEYGGSVWFYVRVEHTLSEFNQTGYPLLRVERDDGRLIEVGPNAWQTYHILDKRMLHIFDFDARGQTQFLQHTYSVMFVDGSDKYPDVSTVGSSTRPANGDEGEEEQTIDWIKPTAIVGAVVLLIGLIGLVVGVYVYKKRQTGTR